LDFYHIIFAYPSHRADRGRDLHRKKKLVSNPALVFFLGTLLSVWEGSLAQAPAPTISPLPSQVRSLLRQRCTDCHAGENPPRGLNLEPGRIRAAIDAESKERPPLKIIDSANPEASYILKKIRGDADIVGSRMPLSQKALTPAEVEILKAWINGLKKNSVPIKSSIFARGERT
jgi:hypothetical protein